MAKLADKSYDLAIVDPPYGIGAGGSFGHYWDCTKGGPATMGVRNSKKDWDDAPPPPEYWRELFRVSKNQIIWGGNYFTNILPVSRGWIGWDKKQPEASSFSMLELAWSSFDIPMKMFRMYATHVTQGLRIHPTQKPIKLYSWLLGRHAKPGDTILDTHMGSGSSVIAAVRDGYEVLACEKDEEYFAAAVERIGRELQQGTFAMTPNGEISHSHRAKTFV